MNNSTDWLLSPSNLTIPDSCCIDPTTCETTQYINGCSTALLALVQSQLVIVAAIGIAFVVGEVSMHDLINWGMIYAILDCIMQTCRMYVKQILFSLLPCF